MYKIALKPNQDNSAVMIRVLKRCSFFSFTYWATVERALCASQHFGFQKHRILSKYEGIAETAVLQKSEILTAYVNGFAIL